MKRFSDVRSWRRIQGQWFAFTRAAVRNDKLPAALFNDVCAALGMCFREGGGKAQLSPGGLAKRANSSLNGTRRVLSELEARSLLDRFYVRERVEGVGVFPRANLWLPRLPDDPATDTLGPLDRMNASLVRWKTALGLEERPWGLNGTPISSRHLSTLRAD